MNFLPLFPLNLVVFPQESLNLHIFEPRYRQLISECVSSKSTFGIPAFIGGKMQQYGTEVSILEVENLYEDGRMDIKTQGICTFEILSFENPIKNKLYSGGEISRKTLDKDSANSVLRQEIIQKINELYALMHQRATFNWNSEVLSFEVAHKIGLSLEQEYKLLCIEQEQERQNYLFEHLNRILPVVREMERTKERIQMNGHFKNLDPLTF